MEVAGVNVRFDGKQALIGDSITLYGGHHWSDESLDEMADVFTEVRPDVIAHESSPIAFALQQLYRPNTDSMRVLEYTVRNETELALIDMDWDPIYEDYPQERINEIIKQAESDVDFGEAPGPTTLDEAREVNQRINEIDGEFYTRFIVERDMILARRVAWLASQYENILGTIGFGHLEAVAHIVADILSGDGAGLTPQNPPLYDASDLLDLTASKEEIVEEANRDLSPARVDRVESEFDRLRKQYQTDSRELYQNPL